MSVPKKARKSSVDKKKIRRAFFILWEIALQCSYVIKLQRAGSHCNGKADIV